MCVYVCIYIYIYMYVYIYIYIYIYMFVLVVRAAPPRARRACGQHSETSVKGGSSVRGTY